MDHRVDSVERSLFFHILLIYIHVHVFLIHFLAQFCTVDAIITVLVDLLQSCSLSEVR